jgi:S1-C subfamily serine protease
MRKSCILPSFAEFAYLRSPSCFYVIADLTACTTPQVQKPVERIIEKVIEREVEHIVEKERIVHQDRVIYQDRMVEVPVERSVEIVDRPSTPKPMMQRHAPPPVPPKQVGIGVLLKRSSQHKDMTVVDHIVPGFACANSGKVNVGDLVIAVDGRDISGWELELIKQLTIGDEGSTITLTCQRGR